MVLAPEAVMAQYLEPNPYRPGPADIRLRAYCVPVKPLVTYCEVAGRDTVRVATDYTIPLAAVEAALAYYERNRTVIDARIAANAG